MCAIDHFTVVCLFAWPSNENEAGGDIVLAISELRRKLVTNNDALCILGPFCGTLRQLSFVYRSHHGEV